MDYEVPPEQRGSHGTVYRPYHRVPEYLNPASDSTWVTGPIRFMMPAFDMAEDRPKPDPLDPADEWTRHIAVLVSLLDYILPEFDDPYEGNGALPFSAAVRLEVYNEILGFKNAPQLRSHLMRSDARHDLAVHELLGLDDIPHQNTIRTARQERIGPAATEFVKNWARRIELIGVKRGYHFPDIDERRLSNNGGVIDVPVELKRGYAQGALDLLRDDLPIEKDESLATWTDYGKHFDYSLHLCDSNGTPEGELENWADNRGLQKHVDVWGDAETFRNDIYRASIDEWTETFSRWTDRLLDAVYDQELRSRYLPVAVDATNIPTWAEEESSLDGVIGTQKLSNTHYSYRILSGQVVSDGMPFQVGHQLQMSGANREDRLEDLLRVIEDRGFNVGIVLADSEFASGRVVNRLKSLGIDFVIAYPKHFVSNHTDAWEAQEQTFGVEPGYVINKNKTPPERAEVTLFGEYQSKLGSKPDDDAQQRLSEYFDPEAEWVTNRQTQRTLAAYVQKPDPEDVFEADNRMRWFTFVTNLDVDEQEARALRQYYHYRWAIESAFADYKTTFLPTTKSTDLGLRTYLYLFGMAAYNAWVAANTKCRRQHLEDSARNRPPIRASRFMTLGQQRYRSEFHTDYINFQE